MPWNLGVTGHIPIPAGSDGPAKAAAIEARVREVVEKNTAELVAKINEIEGAGLSHARWTGEHDEGVELHFSPPPPPRPPDEAMA